MPSIQNFLASLKKKPFFSAEEELEKIKIIKKGSKKEREEAVQSLVENNLRFIFKESIKIFKKYDLKHLSVFDIFNFGVIGFMKAVDKYDPEVDKGNGKARLNTYAFWWIRTTIQRAILDYNSLVRIPTSLSKVLHDYNKQLKELKNILGYEPSVEELMSFLDLNEEDIKKIERSSQTIFSLDSPITKDDNSSATWHEKIRDPNSPPNDPLSLLLEKDIIKQAARILKCLKPKERRIIVSHFGLFGETFMTLEEIGIEMGLTRERIRQIEVEALEKLKHKIKYFIED